MVLLLEPIEIHGKNGPNPMKVQIIAEELELPYNLNNVSYSDLKGPEFTALNPNGRMPAIVDPNTDLTLWESGAIIEYFIDMYDTKRTISFEPGSDEAWHAKQWLYFQVSGQGPYYGQAVWFTSMHPEQIESAQERYYQEIRRVTGVLEAHLQSQPEGEDGPWLVGGKMSYADLAFVPWQMYAKKLTDVSDFPTVTEWLGKLKERPSVVKILEDQDA